MVKFMATHTRHSSGGALAGVLFSIGFLGIYRKIWTARWHRGRTMQNPIWFGVLVFLALWTWVGVDVTNIGNKWKDFAIAGVLAAFLTPFAWSLLVGFWEIVVHFNLSPRQRNLWLSQRQITLPEAQYYKEIALQRLKATIPLAAAGAVYALIQGDTGALGVDMALEYSFVLGPYNYWFNAERVILAGGEVWVDVPPINMGTEFQVRGFPEIKTAWRMWLFVLAVAIWQANGNGGRHVEIGFILFGLFLSQRKHMAQSLTNRAIRRDKISR